IFAYMAALPFANAVVVCVEVGSITPVYGMIGIRFLFAPFVTEVALRLFLTVAEAAGKIAGSRKKGPAEDPANEPEQPAGEKNADD
ncbi:MAG: hypothetical protein ACI38Z_00775, partial [Parafannyhessea sp.]|uniref:hypothetical protein n=1 Tax=Parafannyhessea sp. TaxID=2847324 RepID=UPI003F08C86A